MKMIDLTTALNKAREERRIISQKFPEGDPRREVIALNYLAIRNHLKNNIYSKGYNLKGWIEQNQEIEDINYDYLISRLKFHRQQILNLA